MNMHELESHQEADKGYCSSPKPAWYKKVDGPGEAIVGKFVADFLLGLLENTKLYSIKTAIMKDTSESIVKEHEESRKNKVKIRWAGEPLRAAGGRQGRGEGTNKGKRREKKEDGEEGLAEDKRGVQGKKRK